MLTIIVTLPQPGRTVNDLKRMTDRRIQEVKEHIAALPNTDKSVVYGAVAEGLWISIANYLSSEKENCTAYDRLVSKIKSVLGAKVYEWLRDNTTYLVQTKLMQKRQAKDKIVKNVLDLV